MKFEYGQPYYFVGGYVADIIVPVMKVLIYLKKEELVSEEINKCTYYYQDVYSFIRYGDCLKSNITHEHRLYKIADTSMQHVYDLQGFIDEIILLEFGRVKPVSQEVWNEIFVMPTNETV